MRWPSIAFHGSGLADGASVCKTAPISSILVCDASTNAYVTGNGLDFITSSTTSYTSFSTVTITGNTIYNITSPTALGSARGRLVPFPGWNPAPPCAAVPHPSDGTQRPG